LPFFVVVAQHMRVNRNLLAGVLNTPAFAVMIYGVAVLGSRLLLQQLGEHAPLYRACRAACGAYPA
jgi:hypothetical protein